MWSNVPLFSTLLACLVHVVYSLPQGAPGAGGGTSCWEKDKSNPACQAVRDDKDSRDFAIKLTWFTANGSANAAVEIDEDFCASGTINLGFKLSKNLVSYKYCMKKNSDWDCKVEGRLPWPDILTKFGEIIGPFNCINKCNSNQNDNYFLDKETEPCEELFIDKLCAFSRLLPEDTEPGSGKLEMLIDSDCEIESIGLIAEFNVEQE